MPASQFPSPGLIVLGLNYGRSAFSATHFSRCKTVPESDLTPFICRAACKHYDGVKDARDGISKEFCWYGRSHLVGGSLPCEHFEDGNPVYDDEDSILRL